MRERKEINIFVGDRIRMAREGAGLTQEEFGELVLIGPKNVSDIERGMAGISVSTLKRICEKMSISTLKRICEKMSISSDRLLFGDREFNEIDYLAERLGRLPRWQFAAVESFLNQIFCLFGMLGE